MKAWSFEAKNRYVGGALLKRGLFLQLYTDGHRLKINERSSVFYIAFMFVLLNTFLLDKLKITISCSKQIAFGRFFSLQLTANEEQLLTYPAASFSGVITEPN
jgi:hypothetical protein